MGFLLPGCCLTRQHLMPRACWNQIFTSSCLSPGATSCNVTDACYNQRKRGGGGGRGGGIQRHHLNQYPIKHKCCCHSTVQRNSHFCLCSMCTEVKRETTCKLQTLSAHMRTCTPPTKSAWLGALFSEPRRGKGITRSCCIPGMLTCKDEAFKESATKHSQHDDESS